jgi:hypothetical protein
MLASEAQSLQQVLHRRFVAARLVFIFDDAQVVTDDGNADFVLPLLKMFESLRVVVSCGRTRTFSPMG